MWPDDFDLNVSRESLEKLQIYHDLLIKWQKAINLVSPSTLDDAWTRHFADSVQLVRYIPEGTKTIMDWGSGAGFPGVVLAILLPDVDAHLVESDERKCQFMRTVSRETNTPIRIHTSRIESIDSREIKPEVITARALASLKELLKYARPFLDFNPDLEMVLLKGAAADQEVAEAQGLCEFSFDSFHSVTSAGSKILHVSKIRF